MMILFLMAGILSFQSIPIAQAFSGQLTDAFTDLNRVAEAKSYGDLYFYNYVPMGSVYSTHNASFDMGWKGGGEEFDWRYDKIGSYDDHGIRPFELQLKWKDTTESYLNETYNKKSTGTCELPPRGFNNWLGGMFNAKVQNVRVETSYPYSFFGDTTDSIEVNCQYSSGNVKYLGRDHFETVLNASDNRYNLLIVEAVEFFNNSDAVTGVKPRWKNNVKPVTKSSNSPICETNLGTSDFTSLQDDAVSEINDTVKNQYSQVESQFPLESGLELNRSKIKDYWPTLTVEDEDGNTASTTYYTKFEAESSSSSSTSCTNCCGCYMDDAGTPDDTSDDYQVCPDDEYDISVTVTPVESEVFWTMRDSRYQVPTSDGWKHLTLQIDSYYHNFKND